PAVSGALAELTFDRDRMRAAVTGGMMATDLADYLVTKGATFREAHGAVGRLVREAEQRGVELDRLPPDVITAAHPMFGPDAADWLGAAFSVARREVEGGTGPESVRTQIASAKRSLEPAVEVPRGNEMVW